MYMYLYLRLFYILKQLAQLYPEEIKKVTNELNRNTIITTVAFSCQNLFIFHFQEFVFFAQKTFSSQKNSLLCAENISFAQKIFP